MPRSRSWSIESIARSGAVSCSVNTPDWRSMASTSVVLPWSTWAMIATLRMSARWAMGALRLRGPYAAASVEQLEHALDRPRQHRPRAALDHRALEELRVLGHQGDQLFVRGARGQLLEERLRRTHD